QCTKQNLVLFSKALHPVRCMLSLYFFVAGCIVADNVHLAQGFGRGMTAIGAFMIICSFWNLAGATAIQAGVKRHNKCIILVALLLDFGIVGVQLILGGTMYSRTIPEFSEAFQLDCLLKVPVKYTLEECLEYTRSDRYAGMMLVWRSYNYLSLDYSKYYQWLVTIEKSGVCCGFGPPTRCTDDSRDFPSWFAKSQVGFSPDERYVCGQEEHWYEESYFCEQHVDETAVVLVIGGCKYDYPMGDCMDIDVDASDTIRGCAHELETHMANKIFVHSMLILGLSSLQFASLLSGCCMFWKRAYEDSMPDHVDRHVPWNPYKDNGLLGEDQAAADQRARRKGGSSAKLDPLGVLIMGEMPQINHGTIVPI
ncbi:unnamed protein product, partial [Laminaria digitata]